MSKLIGLYPINWKVNGRVAANVYSSGQYVALDCTENGDVIVEMPKGLWWWGLKNRRTIYEIGSE
ncbi:hypothetical protein EJP82_11960 [Paenibacillus anaericanus]|uniref:Uncharacterized protein n=1 Tax=Paenibacillus anaericanus TaxID=170367 RepID=A0A433Y9Q7_9BACL|nr:hypothetical protein [Paenibacillus anaericanus]RUT46556.1 hypothetical protein EJP82_11960 [Paenibacillus anaericanus]